MSHRDKKKRHFVKQKRSEPKKKIVGIEQLGRGGY
jgi:hypothetical protein